MNTMFELLENGCKNPLEHGFNWLIALEELRDGAHLSRNATGKIEIMAGQWPMCACGQLCQTLERDETGAPRDQALKRLGIEFSTLVVEKRWLCALATFNAIEARTTKLLRLEVS